MHETVKDVLRDQQLQFCIYAGKTISKELNTYLLSTYPEKIKENNQIKELNWKFSKQDELFKLSFSLDNYNSKLLDPVMLYNNYLANLKQSIKADTWIMDRNGIIYIDDHHSIIGKNIFSLFKGDKYNSFHKLQKHLNLGQDSGNYKYTWPIPEGYQSRVITYSSIHIFGKELIICNSFDEAKITELLNLHYTRLNRVLFYLTLTILFFIIIVMLYQQWRKNIQKEKTRLAKFLAPSVVQDILKNKLELNSEAVEKIVTVCFIDIRNFTALSHKLTPTQTTEFLKSFYTICNIPIFSHQGTVDKYLGDSVMAFFGAPIDQKNHEDIAINATLQIIKDFDNLFKSPTHPLASILSETKIDIGIALSTGPVISGPIGTDQKLDYTVIGTTVNLASRLEGLNKRFHSRLITCDQTIKKSSKKNLFNLHQKVDVRGIKENKDLYTFKEFQ